MLCLKMWKQEEMILQTNERLQSLKIHIVVFSLQQKSLPWIIAWNYSSNHGPDQRRKSITVEIAIKNLINFDSFGWKLTTSKYFTSSVDQISIRFCIELNVKQDPSERLNNITRQNRNRRLITDDKQRKTYRVQ